MAELEIGTLEYDIKLASELGIPWDPTEELKILKINILPAIIPTYNEKLKLYLYEGDLPKGLPPYIKPLGGSSDNTKYLDNVKHKRFETKKGVFFAVEKPITYSCTKGEVFKLGAVSIESMGRFLDLAEDQAATIVDKVADSDLFEDYLQNSNSTGLKSSKDSLSRLLLKNDVNVGDPLFIDYDKIGILREESQKRLIQNDAKLREINYSNAYIFRQIEEDDFE